MTKLHALKLYFSSLLICCVHYDGNNLIMVYIIINHLMLHAFLYHALLRYNLPRSVNCLYIVVHLKLLILRAKKPEAFKLF